jgi:hypothetical protein
MRINLIRADPPSEQARIVGFVARAGCRRLGTSAFLFGLVVWKRFFNRL